MLSGDLYRDLLDGVVVTVQVTVLAAVPGTVLAVAGGIAALAANRIVRWLTVVYVELFRGVAAIILLFWIFYTLPQLFDIFLSPMQAGVLALGTNMGAYGPRSFAAPSKPCPRVRPRRPSPSTSPASSASGMWCSPRPR